jgi:hypothetical protein
MWMIMGRKRIAVVLSLASYLLASTAIHALHDHSASGHGCHAEGSCEIGAFHQNGGDRCNSAGACDGSAGGDRHSSPNNCEDSCFACRFVAAKSILPAIVLPVERFETVCHVDPPLPTFAPVTQPDCSLCRGPPSAS